MPEPVLRKVSLEQKSGGSSPFFSTRHFISLMPSPLVCTKRRGKGELSSREHMSITDADFKFENTVVKVIGNRNEGKIELAGLKIEPIEEGREYEVRFWIAKKLEDAGIVRFRGEDMLDVVKLHKIHWKERVQPANRVSPIQDDFYPKLRRYLSRLEEDSKKDSEKLKEREKSARISHDIVNCRVKKIVSLAASQYLMVREEGCQ